MSEDHVGLVELSRDNVAAGCLASTESWVVPQCDREIIKGYPSYSAWVLICGNFYSPELLLAQEGTLTKDSYSLYTLFLRNKLCYGLHAVGALRCMKVCIPSHGASPGPWTQITHQGRLYGMCWLEPWQSALRFYQALPSAQARITVTLCLNNNGPQFEIRAPNLFQFI